MNDAGAAYAPEFGENIKRRVRTRQAEDRPPVRSEDVPKLLNEAPGVVGIMSTSISGGGSLDSAVRAVAEDGPPISKKIFRRVADLADTRVRPDMRASLISELSRLPDSASPYSMAIHMAVSASEAHAEDERERSLRDASEIALTGLKEAGKSFSASLNAPCMAVFALGIMVPMVLMCIVPMLGFGGLFGSSPIGIEQIAVLTLVAVPAAVACVVLMISRRNPFLKPGNGDAGLRNYAPLMSVPVLAAVCMAAGMEADTAGCIGCIAGGAASFAAVLPAYMRESARKKIAVHLEDAVFDAGNRLLSGGTFEDAAVGAIASREGCAGVAEALRREFAVCRGDEEDAVARALSPVSETVSDAFRAICRAASKDLRDAGKLAISIGRQMKDQRSVRNGIRAELRSMTDTMSATAVFFAPMVLGLSVAMLAPVSSLSGSDISGTSSVLVLYLAELCVLISALNSFLEGDARPETVARRISMFLPVSALVFLVSMSIQL
ncbi:hypothetical protein AUQ37_08315 [Candidatus Methanomethylophilus sp. 1R26]|uniref:hypothetical protein n=1 Tax=Candidatus Methanomethylophilus sp. 1R26 TaxID=1769296 RepID=UPI0007376715|nr:hypothetical protein [Candidatus Methanomethylophilus sp. 1R26]KUE73687.1 hypothetical protein AUQ37_08315 [Candidatus Methanomethylophilus sp. 1R26]TQS78872.1 MAG: hypothetical protein A3Q59_00735 [Methanomethylophilus alvi]